MVKQILASLIGLLVLASVAGAQPYSSPPTLQAFQATGLSMPYTAGIVQVGGTQQVIQLGAVTLTDNMGSCTAPQYAQCNLVYWNGNSTTLSVTLVPQVAFSPGNAIVGFVTTNGGAIVNVVTFSQASMLNDNLVPTGTMIGGGLRLPICNAILKQGCQPSLGSLNGY